MSALVFSDVERRTTRAALKAREARVKHFDLIFALLGLWPVIGLFIDAWAHNHIAALETFFTPWHGVLYSGFGATAGYLAWTMARERGLRSGYELSLIGAVAFALAGVGDLLWHEVLGIEQGVEALFSPTHLALALGGILLLSGPIRAAWRTTPLGGAERSRVPLPVLLSLLATLSVVTLFTEYAHPFFDPTLLAGPLPLLPRDEIFHIQMHGVLGMLVYSGLLTGIVLMLVVRWTVPLGAFTFLFGGNAILMSTTHDHQALVPIALAAGLLADVVVHVVRPSADRPARLRLVAAVVPLTYYALYVGALHASVGVWWSVHMATGGVILSGVVGLLLSLVVLTSSSFVSNERRA
jgi:hypothetical protein